MFSKNMKLLSSLMVIIGVGLCATFGARLTPKTLSVVSIELSQTKEKPIDPQQAVVVEAPMNRVTTWWSLSALPFSSGLLLIVFGSVLARRLQNAELTEIPKEEPQDQKVDIQLSLTTLTKHLGEVIEVLELDQEQQKESLVQTKAKIEELQISIIEPLVEQRDRLRLTMGTNQFIEVFGPIATAERKLNRAWAACVDAHRKEVLASLRSSKSSFELALSLNTQD